MKTYLSHLLLFRNRAGTPCEPLVLRAIKAVSAHATYVSRHLRFLAEIPFFMRLSYVLPTFPFTYKRVNTPHIDSPYYKRCAPLCRVLYGNYGGIGYHS